MRKVVYALVTTNCNLSCPYCDAKNSIDNYDREKFINALDDFDGNIILFGGEPTLYPDRLIDIFLSRPSINNKITSISTNLISFDDRVLTIFNIIGSISTSWNPSRFLDNEYKIWLNNLHILSNKIPDVRVRILITMTDELLDIDSLSFNRIVSEWDKSIIKDIRFEYYVGDETNPNYFDRCDNWLCDIYKGWNSCIDIDNTKHGREIYYDCRNVFTLYPNGFIRNGCHHGNNIIIPNECYTCDKINICKPCQLQKYCSYPKKFMELIQGGIK